MNTLNINKFSRPSLSREITLKSNTAQKIYIRYFEKLQNCFFALSILYPQKLDPKQCAIIENECIKEIDKINDEFNKAINEQQKIISNDKNKFNQNELCVNYSNKKIFQSQIISPYGLKILDLLMKVDLLMQLFDQCWLSGLINDKEHQHAIYAWQKLICQTFGRLITFISSVKNQIKDNNKK